MMPDDPVIMPPSATTLATFGSGGALGKVVNAQINGKTATVTVITRSASIEGLLMDPGASTQLLPRITYANRPTVAHAPASPANTAVVASGRTIGVIYDLADSDGGAAVSTRAYIDNRYPIALGFESTGNSLEFVAIGEPVSNIPASGDFTYSGLIAAGLFAITSGTTRYTSDSFEMGVTFGADDAKVTRFHGDFGAAGYTEIPNDIAIDMTTGTFNGVFTTGTSMFRFPGTVYGQFHGDGATGVTGAYRTDNGSTVGVFAASR